MSWKKYLVSVLIFSGFGLVFVFFITNAARSFAG